MGDNKNETNNQKEKMIFDGNWTIFQRTSAFGKSSMVQRTPPSSPQKSLQTRENETLQLQRERANATHLQEEDNPTRFEELMFTDIDQRLQACSATTPVADQAEMHTGARSSTPRGNNESDTFNRLGKKIDLLFDYVKPRNNVHHEIKRLVTSIKNLYIEHSHEVERLNDENQTTQIIANLAKQITVCCETQTTPTISNSRHNGKDIVLLDSEMENNNKRRRSNEQTTPNGHTQKKGKQKADETQVLGAIPNPAEEEDEASKPDNEKGPDWQLVRSKTRKKRERIPRPRPDAIKITKTGTMSYAEILKKMKGDSNLNDLSGKVTRIRRTEKGDLLLELGEDVHPKELGFQTALENSLGTEAKIQTLTQIDEVMVEIKDIDEATTKIDVHEAIAAKFMDAKDLPIECIKSLRAAYRGTQTAVVAVPSSIAKVMKTEGKVRIGWVICRIREKKLPLRCFKCWQYGHIAKSCRCDVDRSGLCYKCGGNGHRVKECNEEANCMLCQERANHNHIAGSARCPAYMEALKKTHRL